VASRSAALRYVAFLRAVNVGGRIVKMTELKKIFEDLGLDDLSTFIASGNVIFSSTSPAAALATRIEAALAKALGYDVVTMLRRVDEVHDVADHKPFTARTMGDAALYVGFMRTSAAPAAIKRTLALQTEVDSLHVHGSEIYWLARKKIAESTITGAAIEKALATPVTFRNITTVRRLAAKCPRG
jgi:uncharacterized protein (DUF1697 family)